MEKILKAPFPYFGGKSKVAGEVWARFGTVQNYVEPFFGSGAVMLARPGGASGIETVNDKSGFVSNFWRSLAMDPEAVAKWADWPVNERDLEARHYWLVTEGERMLKKISGNPDLYDAKIAGWWVGGISAWIGAGWCSGKGPWQWVGDEWQKKGDAGKGVNRQLPHLSSAGAGINRQHSGLGELSDRLKKVRVCNGDWSRVCGKSVTYKNGLTAVFLDPPYDANIRTKNLYEQDEGTPAADCRKWAIKEGSNPKMRICLAGYSAEHQMPPDWTTYRWKAVGGYAKTNTGKNNANEETLWFSSACLNPQKTDLFGGI